MKIDEFDLKHAFQKFAIDESDWPRIGETVERANMPLGAPLVMVYVDRVEAGIPFGEFTNAFLPEPVPFCGLSDLILKMDAVYDKLDFPQSDRNSPTIRKQRKNRYDHLAPYEPRYYRRYPTGLRSPRTDVALAVYTRYRQNGSWQGTLYFVGKHASTRNYVSALQCMKMMQEAIDLYQAPAADGKTQQG